MAISYNKKYNPFTGKLQFVLDSTSVDSLTFKAGVANVAALPSSGNTKNDARIVNDTHNLYVWSGTAWVDQGDIIDMDWSAITGKPTASVADIDDAVNKKHAQNGDTDLDATFEATFVKKVDTVNELSDITSAGADIEDAVTKKHAQNGDTDLDSTFEATFVKKVDTVNELSDITSAGADIEDAVTKKHASGSDNETTTSMGTLINGADAKTTPVDADLVPIRDTTGSLLEKVTWANIKATLKTYFDTLYGESGASNDVLDNLLLNAYRISGIGTLVKRNLVDGIMDIFTDETDVDVATSGNETYDAAGDYYEPVIAGVDIVPHDLTSNSSNTPFITSASSEESAANSGAWKAFEGNLNHYWVSDDDVDGAWLKVDMGSGNTYKVSKYKLVANSVSQEHDRQPKAWVFQGSNNDSDWTTIDTESDQTSWGTSEAREFTCDTITTEYRYFRLLFSENNGDSNLSVGELYIYEATTINMSLISESTEAEAVPESARIFVVEEDTDVITINTDLTAYMSRDDGAHWVQATLTKEVIIEDSKKVYSGTADLSGQASDKTVCWKIETSNDKDMKIHSVGYILQ